MDDEIAIRTDMHMRRFMYRNSILCGFVLVVEIQYSTYQGETDASVEDIQSVIIFHCDGTQFQVRAHKRTGYPNLIPLVRVSRPVLFYI
jgi:hypothetical protein